MTPGLCLACAKGWYLIINLGVLVKSIFIVPSYDYQFELQSTATAATKKFRPARSDYASQMRKAIQGTHQKSTSFGKVEALPNRQPCNTRILLYTTTSKTNHLEQDVGIDSGGSKRHRKVSLFSQSSLALYGAMVHQNPRAAARKRSQHSAGEVGFFS